MARDTYEQATWQRHGQPAIKTKKDNERHTETSKHVMKEGQAKKGWDNRGRPTSRVTVPGYNGPSGTPGYIRSAASAAEKLTRTGALDCGYGKQDVHRTHREYGAGAGKPDVKKDAGYRNPKKESQ